MAGITFSEAEVKKLILALAGSKAMGEEMEDSEEKDSEEKPEMEDSEKKAEDKPEESAGKPFKESTKDMLKRKLEEKDA